jgi:hypothetical protein
MDPAQSDNEVPETVSKSTALFLVLLFVLATYTAYGFGADAGYLKGREDCSGHPLTNQELRNP